jgi:Yip1 domain
MIKHAIGILFSPNQTWPKIAATADRGSNFVYVLVFAVLPAVAWFYGTTRVGWSIGSGEVIKLTAGSATALIALFYCAMVVAVSIIGWAIHWMAVSYGAQSTLMRGIAIAGFTATPLFIAGLVGFYPVPALDMLIGVLAVGWSLYLLYVGIPAVMNVPQERGFLFASAVVAVCLVILIAIMGASVLLWDMGFAPEYTN